MHGTIRLEDMSLFAEVAAAQSFTVAARTSGVPKQTLSRRVAALERALGVQLLRRTTRRLHLTDAGAAYAARCAEIVRIAAEANRAASDVPEVPRGTLRITADPVLGEAFLTDLVVDYARTWPEVRLDVVLTRRRVDLAAEGFDVAFRVGQLDDPTLSAQALGPARVRYCASPAYLARRGVPRAPGDLPAHDCLVVSDGEPVRWPFRGARSSRAIPVSARLTLTSFAMARAAAIGGLGIAIFPEFACAEDLRHGRLASVLDDWVIDVGSVWLVHAGRRVLPARARVFADLARERFGRAPPWVPANGASSGA
jgi:DNA-binding transcriptional LysR family regulator